MNYHNKIKFVFKGETTLCSAEGATTPETLRQKDLEHVSSGKKIRSHQRSKSLRQKDRWGI